MSAYFGILSLSSKLMMINIGRNFLQPDLIGTTGPPMLMKYGTYGRPRT